MSETKQASVPFKNLKVREGFNVRKDMGNLKALSEGIIQHGLNDTPLVVYQEGDDYIIKGGHRRYLAMAKLIEEKRKSKNFDPNAIPVIIAPLDETDEQKTIALITENSGKPLNMLEEAEVYRRMRDDFKKTPKEVAEIFSVSQMHVGNCYKLLTASPEIKKAVLKGEVSATTIVEMLKGDTPEEVEKKVTEAKAKKKPNKKGKVKVTKKDVKVAAAKKPKKKAGGKPKFSLDKLEQFYDALEEGDIDTDKVKMKVLFAIIEWGKGRKTAEELVKTFKA